jgi:hypothetical protein
VDMVREGGEREWKETGGERGERYRERRMF